MADNKDGQYYYMYGKHSVLAAVQNKNRKIEKVFCTKEIFDANNKLITPHRYEIVNNDFLTQKLGQKQNHQGIIVHLRTIFSDNLYEIEVSDPKSKIAILDQITDPQNIGSIIRSAAAFGINAIIMQKDNSPSENATIAKAASGNLEIVKIIKVTNLRSSIEFLKKHQFWILGLDGNAKENINTKILSGKIAIILGSEDKGIRRLIAENCDYIAKIPMLEQVESLNVSNAASIIFYLAHNS